MKRIFTKPSLSREYFYFSIIVALVIIGISCWNSWSSYQLFEQEQEFRYHDASEKVAAALTESFDYVEHFFHFIGDKIAAAGKNDPQTIADILREKSGKNDKLNTDIFTWTLFDFVNPEGYVIASSMHGMLPKPVKIDKYKRSWVETAPKHPWTLQLSYPDIGVTSGEPIIPTGYGVTDKNNRFLGILSIGFNIEKLTRRLDRALEATASNYILLTQNLHIITSSSDKKLLGGRKIAETLSHSPLALRDSGKLPQPLTLGNVTYHYYRYVYPSRYLILIGENNYFTEKRLQSLLYPGLINNALLGIFFVVLLYFFHRFIIFPMARLSNAAHQLSEGHYDTAIPHVNTLEATHLASALEQLKQLIISVENARGHLEQRVQERTAELEKALAVKTDFLNNLSHEVRTPIQGVTVFTTSLVERWQHLSDKQRFELACKARNSAERLFSFVNDMLDISRISAGKMALSLQKHDISTIIEAVIEEKEALTLGKAVSVIYTKPDVPLIVECDAVRIGQVIRNLLTNAIKFTQEGKIILSIHNGKVEYEDGRTAEAVCFSITDNGIGIPANELNTIFSPFTQSSRTKNGAGGTGLGLSIAREIMHLHYGRIWATNNSGKGATFHFSLPFTPPASKFLPEPSTEENKKAIILMIDDERICLDMMQILLLDTNYQLAVAESAAEGLEYIIAQPHTDIILLDMMMPDMHGLEVLKIVKDNPKTAHIPVIIQSGIASEVELQQALELGAAYSIRKPYKKEAILAMLEHTLSSKHNG